MNQLTVVPSAAARTSSQVLNPGASIGVPDGVAVVSVVPAVVVSVVPAAVVVAAAAASVVSADSPAVVVAAPSSLLHAATRSAKAITTNTALQPFFRCLISVFLLYGNWEFRNLVEPRRDTGSLNLQSRLLHFGVGTETVKYSLAIHPR
jgi:hypothetical protein